MTEVIEPDRRTAFAADVRERTGIDETMIRSLVNRFYERVRADDVLGPIFAARINDWEPHLERMRAFWSSVALMTARYHGRPMQLHAVLPVTASHFDRWLSLFADTARSTCPPPAAEHFIERAHTIAESLELGIAAQRGLFLKKGERLQSAVSSTNVTGAEGCAFTTQENEGESDRSELTGHGNI